MHYDEIMHCGMFLECLLYELASSVLEVIVQRQIFHKIKLGKFVSKLHDSGVKLCLCRRVNMFSYSVIVFTFGRYQ